MMTTGNVSVSCGDCLFKNVISDGSVEDIYQKVCVDKMNERLPGDCPEDLRELIDACRSYDSFLRPTAGGKPG